MHIEAITIGAVIALVYCTYKSLPKRRKIKTPIHFIDSATLIQAIIRRGQKCRK